MDAFEMKERVRPLMEHDEEIRWIGASSATAFLPSHIPFVLFVALFVFASSWTTLTGLLRGDLSVLTLTSTPFLLASAILVYIEVRSVMRDIGVEWVVTDRRVYRLARWHVVQTDIRAAVSIETRPRGGGRGDVTVTMPETRRSDGRTTMTSVVMTDVDHMDDAYRAVARVTTTMTTT